MPQTLPIYPQPILFDLAAERFAVNAQDAGCLLAPAFGATEHELNVPFFKIFQTEVLFGKDLKLTLSLGDKRWQMLGLDHLAVFQYQDPLDGMLQFSNVTRP